MTQSTFLRAVHRELKDYLGNRCRVIYDLVSDTDDSDGSIAIPTARLRPVSESALSDYSVVHASKLVFEVQINYPIEMNTSTSAGSPKLFNFFNLTDDIQNYLISLRFDNGDIDGDINGCGNGIAWASTDYDLIDGDDAAYSATLRFGQHYALTPVLLREVSA
jgi:hypothetical protein